MQQERGRRVLSDQRLNEKSLLKSRDQKRLCRFEGVRFGSLNRAVLGDGPPLHFKMARWQKKFRAIAQKSFQQKAAGYTGENRHFF
jgi:hypothetical protein